MKLVTNMKIEIEVIEDGKPGLWYRLNQLPNAFVWLRDSTAKAYVKEMETVPEFQGGVIKPGHSTTFVHYDTFVDFLRWKDKLKYR